MLQTMDDAVKPVPKPLSCRHVRTAPYRSGHRNMGELYKFSREEIESRLQLIRARNAASARPGRGLPSLASRL